MIMFLCLNVYHCTSITVSIIENRGMKWLDLKKDEQRTMNTYIDTKALSHKSYYLYVIDFIVYQLRL